MSLKKVHIIGAGGVGGYYGAVLARGGANVTMVCRPPMAEVLRKKGLTVHDSGGTFSTRAFAVADSFSALGDADLILLAVKTYDLDDLARALSGRVAPGCSVLTLQNGIEADLMVKKQFPENTILAGMTFILSTMIEPGVIRQINYSERTFIRFGLRGQTDAELLEKVCAYLSAHGVAAQISDDIVRDLWDKFIWLANFAGMTGSRRCAVGPVVNEARNIEEWMQGVDEVIALARALNVPLVPGVREKIAGWLERYKTENTDAKPSLTKDLEQGKRTEIEALSGTIIRLAREAGISVPVHERFYRAIAD